ncbi:variable surface lipoprotein [Mycoplasmopsis agalactiae]|uniref:variable surface lipoprotein n=1 Tax=Mycoplasmopsis agalactiae TaxID=2110 RepID=UPI00211BCBE2|nr:variable surface lipoprotein [Mycoplasmopsis agalactiae]UUM25783.1 variable surface lipoprotein [Mycoplasmopsis agalactiae]
MKRNKLLLSFGSLSVFSAIPFIAAKCDDTSEKDNKTPINPGKPGETTENKVVKVELGKLGEKTKEELNKLAKDGVTKAQVVTVLKTEKGLENLTESDLAKVEFKDNKLTIEANKESKLVSGTYEYSAQKQTPDAVIDLSKVQVNGEVKALLKAEAKEKPDKAKVLAALKKDNNFAKLTESDFEVLFNDSTLTVKATAGSKVIKGELSISSKTELDNITLTEEVKKGLQTESEKSQLKAEDIVNVLKKLPELKDLDAKDVEIKKESNKLTVAAKSTSAKFTGTLNFVFKVMLNMVMTEDIKKELQSEAKDKPNTSNVVNILKKIPGLVTLKTDDVKVEFGTGKLVISASETSDLIMGTVSIENSASIKINLSTYNFDEKTKMNLLASLDEKNDEDNNSSKSSIWFTLGNLFKNGLEEDEFDLEIDKSNSTITITASKDSKRLEGKFTLSKNKSNSVQNRKVDLSKLKLDENFVKEFLEEFEDGNFASLSAVKLLKKIKELEKIIKDDIEEIKAEKDATTSANGLVQDVYKKVTIKASASSKLISGTLVIEKKAK